MPRSYHASPMATVMLDVIHSQNFKGLYLAGGFLFLPRSLNTLYSQKQALSFSSTSAQLELRFFLSRHIASSWLLGTWYPNLNLGAHWFERSLAWFTIQRSLPCLLAMWLNHRLPCLLAMWLNCRHPGSSSRPFSFAYRAQVTGSSAAMLSSGSYVLSIMLTYVF